MQQIYVTVSGHRVAYREPAPEVKVLLHRLEAALGDATCHVAEMVAWVYDESNPILEVVPSLGRAGVTPAVLANPVYRVMTDLIHRKRLAQLGEDPRDGGALYTLSMAEAVERCGLTEAHLRDAIRDWRLASWVRDGQLFLRPETVDSYVAAFRSSMSALRPEGARPAIVRACVGSAKGINFHVHVPGGELQRESRPTSSSVVIVVSYWSEMGIFATAKNRAPEFFRVALASTPERIRWVGDFFVEGYFTIVERVYGRADAHDAWNAYRRRWPRRE